MSSLFASHVLSESLSCFWSQQVFPAFVSLAAKAEIFAATKTAIRAFYSAYTTRFRSD